MASAPSKLYADDVSLLVVLLDVNPYFWGALSAQAGGGAGTNLPTFSRFLNHALPFLNSILLLNQINQVVVIATGVNSCDCIFDSSTPENGSVSARNVGGMPGPYYRILEKLEEFVIKDQRLCKGETPVGNVSSLLSGSLSLALCYIQRVFKEGLLHPQPRGSPDGPEQYVFHVLLPSFPNLRHIISALKG